jgi:NADH-quinone oxidoreductase subunit C
LEKEGLTVTHLGPEATGKEMIGVAPDQLLQVGSFLRDNADCQFDYLLSVSGVDNKTHRTSVVHLYSLTTHEFVILKTDADDTERVPSLYPIWPAADWHERESYDLLGIVYTGHPDLRRILMPSDWIGHPLRKDYKENDPRLVWNRR